MKKKLCIYHASCMDGLMAAAIVVQGESVQGREVELHSAHYGDVPPDVTGRDVIIVDFSYPRGVMISLIEEANDLVVLDHHKTARENLEGLNQCYFDTDKCGAVMTWEYYNEDAPMPLVVRYVQDRDLWQWKLSNSRAFSAGLRTIKGSDGARIYMLLAIIEEDSLTGAITSDLLATGEILYAAQTEAVDRAVRNFQYNEVTSAVTIDGVKYPYVNVASGLVSETLEAILKLNYDIAIGYFVIGDQVIHSIRSVAGVDSTFLSTKFGGGGHPQASGFKVPLWTEIGERND